MSCRRSEEIPRADNGDLFTLTLQLKADKGKKRGDDGASAWNSVRQAQRPVAQLRYPNRSCPLPKSGLATIVISITTVINLKYKQNLENGYSKVC
jgi:hypothetical protein